MKIIQDLRTEFIEKVEILKITQAETKVELKISIN